MRHLGRAIALDPELSEARLLRGSALAAQGRLDAAIAEFETLVARSPRLPDARYRLAVLYQQQGRVDDAVRQLREAIASDPAHRPSRELLDRLLRR